jgi:hypothetical protein
MTPEEDMKLFNLTKFRNNITPLQIVESDDC